jgi:ferric hydroxamate transport system permease protein
MRHAWALLTLAIFLGVNLFLVSASDRVVLSNWPDTIFGRGPKDLDQIILLYGLLPRAVVAILAGAALGLSGALLQQLLRNPIADPSTLGISAGAQLAIVVATLYFPQFLDGSRTAVALTGAGAAAFIVFALGWRSSFEPVTMVVSGMLVGVTAAAMSAALTLAQGEYLMSLVTWNGGSLSQQDWSVSRTLLVELFVGIAFSLLLLRPLLLLGLGEESARSLGVNLRWIRLGVAVIATSLAGFVAADVGLISFVGLAAAAFLRGCGIRRPSAVILLSPVAGGLFLWLCDGAVQVLAGATGEAFPTGSITGLVGGPILLWLLPKVRSLRPQGQNYVAMNRVRFAKGLMALAMFVPVIIVLALFLGNDGKNWALLSYANAADLSSLRWPRLLAAAGAGGLLALTGAILQRLTGNPMASPEVIGVSGGAGLGFAAALTLAPTGGPYSLVVGAAAGGLATMAVVLIFARRQNLPPEKLLLAGIAVSSLSSSVLAALMAAGDQRAWQILAWIGGTAASATPDTAIFLAVLAVFMLFAAMSLVRWLGLLPLGQPTARSLGVPVGASRVVTLGLCGLATGAASVLVGPLSFVGLIAPHIAVRAGFATARDHLVASFVLGGLIMAFADFGARTATFPYELPLGLFAAMIGAPYLIWLVVRR